jgi:hypothetical protein
MLDPRIGNLLWFKQKRSSIGLGISEETQTDPRPHKKLSKKVCQNIGSEHSVISR